MTHRLEEEDSYQALSHEQRDGFWAERRGQEGAEARGGYPVPATCHAPTRQEFSHEPREAAQRATEGKAGGEVLRGKVVAYRGFNAIWPNPLPPQRRSKKIVSMGREKD